MTIRDKSMRPAAMNRPALWPTPRVGWQCPVCGRCYSPMVMECSRCRPKDNSKLRAVEAAADAGAGGL